MNGHDSDIPPITPHRASSAPARSATLLALSLLLLLAACATEQGPPLGGEGDGTSYLACQEYPAGSTQPELRCVAEAQGVELAIPWQGRKLDVEARSPANLGEPAGNSEFEPTGAGPIVDLVVVDDATRSAVTQFDPPVELRVDYGASQFTEAEPQVGVGELGLGSWDSSGDQWLIVGHGVFESGFWVADPRIGQQGLTHQGNPGDGLPRFKLSGDESSGEAVALLSEIPGNLAPAWGAMPFDPAHTVVEFDQCSTALDQDLGVQVVECVSETGSVTVRVPYQGAGTIVPQVVALPLNKDATLATPSDGGQTPEGVPDTELDRSLINFLVVDAAAPDTVLTSFDPPIEYEIAYTSGDISTDPNNPRVLTVNYWDEVREELVVLGWGNTEECFDPLTGDLKVGCPWGMPAAATPTDDPAYVKLEQTRFYKMLDAQGNGRAKFYFDEWGDRMVAFGK